MVKINDVKEKNPENETLSETIKKTAEHYLTAIYVGAEEAYNTRLKVCESCDKYLKSARICSVCKCFMPAKIRLRASKCPIGKW